jgi:hypothetical protein
MAGVNIFLCCIKLVVGQETNNGGVKISDNVSNFTSSCPRIKESILKTVPMK